MKKFIPFIALLFISFPAFGAYQACKVNRVPTVPLNLSATPGDGEVALDWDVPASENEGAIVDYVVEFKTTAGSTWTVVSGVSTLTDYTRTGLTNGTSYDFRVCGLNKYGCSPYATASATPSP